MLAQALLKILAVRNIILFSHLLIVKYKYNIKGLKIRDKIRNSNLESKGKR